MTYELSRYTQAVCHFSGVLNDITYRIQRSILTYPAYMTNIQHIPLEVFNYLLSNQNQGIHSKKTDNLVKQY